MQHRREGSICILLLTFGIQLFGNACFGEVPFFLPSFSGEGTIEIIESAKQSKTAYPVVLAIHEETAIVRIQTDKGHCALRYKAGHEGPEFTYWGTDLTFFRNRWTDMLAMETCHVFPFWYIVTSNGCQMEAELNPTGMKRTSVSNGPKSVVEYSSSYMNEAGELSDTQSTLKLHLLDGSLQQSETQVSWKGDASTHVKTHLDYSDTLSPSRLSRVTYEWYLSPDGQEHDSWWKRTTVSIHMSKQIQSSAQFEAVAAAMVQDLPRLTSHSSNTCPVPVQESAS